MIGKNDPLIFGTFSPTRLRAISALGQYLDANPDAINLEDLAEYVLSSALPVGWPGVDDGGGEAPDYAEWQQEQIKRREGEA